MWKQVILVLSIHFLFTVTKKDKIWVKQGKHYWAAVGECLIEHSLGVDDLNLFESDVKDLPETYLCFYKCLYTRIGLLTSEGKITIESTFGVAVARGIAMTLVSQIVECFNKLIKIETCKKVVDLDQCFTSQI